MKIETCIDFIVGRYILNILLKNRLEELVGLMIAVIIFDTYIYL